VKWTTEQLTPLQFTIALLHTEGTCLALLMCYIPRIPAYLDHKIWGVEHRGKREALIGYLPPIVAAGSFHYPFISPYFRDHAF
jgi:hypothetical protein